MFRLALLLLPSIVFFTWACILTFRRDKSASQRWLMALSIAACVYFYIDAHYVMHNPGPDDYLSIVRLDMISQFLTLALPPILFLYVRALEWQKLNVWYSYVLFFPAILLGSASAVIYGIMGLDNAAAFIASADANGGIAVGFEEPIYHMHNLVCTRVLNGVLLVEIVLLLAYMLKTTYKAGWKMVNFKKFRENRQQASTFNTQVLLAIIFLAICGVRIILGRVNLMKMSYLSALLSFLLAFVGMCICYIGAWFPDRHFTIWDLQHPSVIPGQIPDQTPEDAKKKIATAEKPEEKSSLLEAFISYMSKQKPYLNPELSIADVARDLYTNRTYISVLMNNHFGQSFRDYINAQRITTAKELMLANPDEILESIAEKSGFVSDSQLVKKFKEMEGISPRDWQELHS